MMIQIEDTIISFEVVEKQFCCDFLACQGGCCVAGDSGAPLEPEEILAIEDALPAINQIISKKSKEVIKKDGVAVIDTDGDLVTPLIENKECAFVVFNNGLAECAIEKCYEKGECNIQKPVSCHLYPIRITKYNKFTAVNFHEWEICKPAIPNGKKRALHIYEFTKPALIRKFGKEWYDQLCQAAEYVKNKND